MCDTRVAAVKTATTTVLPATAADFSNAEIEAGRRLFAGEWSFISAAGSVESLPRAGELEVAFAGRSNVGKSSLINALTGRKALAARRIEHARPHPTADLLCRIEPARAGGFTGLRSYAAAGKAKAAAWGKVVEAYLRKSQALARVYLLIDARHGLKHNR